MTLDSVQSCRHDGWRSVAKYLTEDVSLLLKSDLKDVQTVLSIIFKSPPADMGEFIKWVAEVRRQEAGSFCLTLSEEEKGRITIKVFHSFSGFLFHVYIVVLFPCELYLFNLDFF